MKPEFVVSLPKTFRQRYSVLVVVLCIGVALSVYWSVMELKVRQRAQAMQGYGEIQLQLDRIGDRLVDVERDAGKLRALLDAATVNTIEDNGSTIETFNRYQGSIVNFRLLNSSSGLPERIGEVGYRIEWQKQSYGDYLEVGIPLEENNYILSFKINLTELISSVNKNHGSWIYVGSEKAFDKEKESDSKWNFAQCKDIYIFANKIQACALPQFRKIDDHFFSIFFFMRILAACLVAGVAHMVERREQNIRDVVRYRTRELAAANASLAKEIAAHRFAARQMLEGEQQLRAIADALPMAILQLNIRSELQFLNKTASQWLGMDSLLISDTTHQQTVDWLLGIQEKSRLLISGILDQAASGKSVSLSAEKIIFEDGSERFLKIQALPKRDNKYSHIGAYLIMMDISDQVMAQENIRRSNENHIILSELGQLALSSERLEQLFSVVVSQLSRALNHVVVYLAKMNQAQDNFFTVMAASDSQLIGYSAHLPTSASLQNSLTSGVLDTLTVVDVPMIRDEQLKDATQSVFMPLIVSKVQYGFIGIQRQKGSHFENYELYLIQAIGHLLSQAIFRNQTESILFNEKERAEVTLASITDAVVTTNQVGHIEFINSSAEKMLGWPRKEVIGQPIHRVMRITEEGSHEYIKNPLEECLEKGEVIIGNGQLILYNRYGFERAIDCSAAPLHTPSGNVMGGVLVFRDVTSQRQLSNQLSHQATHDALTGLINRFEFEHRLNHILSITSNLSDSINEYSENALLYLDLDQFKVVNDTCGHAAGDALLRQLSAILLQRLRKRDTLARLGGDEFAVLLEHCPPAQAERIANELRQTVRDFRFSWDGKIFRVGVSIGLINFGKHTTTLGQLLSAADTACYLAKESGRDRIQVSRMNDTPLSEAHQQMNWVARLQQALEENRFKLFAQEIRALHEKPNQPKHYEILVRLLDESQRMILPGAFIPAAERYNLMTQIDRWVIQESLSWLSSYSAQKDNPEIILGLNLSGRSLGDETILPIIRDMIKVYQIDPGQLCFEITETAAITNMHIASRLIQGLREMGCHFALDDFGSGMSSFGYLKNLPVDYLKIDGNFVKDILQDPIDWVMVESISKVGQAMGLHVIAEYAESEFIIQRLKELGVDYAQGYGIGKPVPLQQIFYPENGSLKSFTFELDPAFIPSEDI